MHMTYRERFRRLFAGEEVDRVPFVDLMDIWPSTIERWKGEGLDRHATVDTVRAIVGVDITFPWESQFGLDITEVRRTYPTEHSRLASRGRQRR
ncbi:MAG: hypothetical protein JXR37_25210 [Kiritimatiellae bacterium]|nr:hypothetical protein [Kiritimatiellia bacterium]